MSIDSALLQEARANGIQLSALLEAAVREKLRQTASEQWLRENREAIRAYTEEIGTHGVFSDGFRAF